MFLASLSVRDGTVEIGKPMNISNSPGYDNQPFFTPDGAAVPFTSVRGDRKPDPASSAATRGRRTACSWRPSGGNSSVGVAATLA